eukprot:125426-Prorocentrum_lima.AAC.1
MHLVALPKQLRPGTCAKRIPILASARGGQLQARPSGWVIPQGAGALPVGVLHTCLQLSLHGP